MFKQISVAVLFLLTAGGMTWAEPIVPPKPEEGVIQHPERYFPDDIGLEWTYTGSEVDQVQRVATYTNVATVRGVTQKKGVSVLIFSESNRANQGPAESYFQKDKKGITYFGSNATTPFEQQLVPYRVIPFPIILHKPHIQVQKRDLSYDFDLDHDGINEKADTLSEVTAVGKETVSTGAGTFRDTIRFEGKMTIWITLSSDQKVVPIVDTTTHWFAKDVGMVKGTEKIEFPEINGRALPGTIIIEELTAYTKKLPPS